MLLPALNAAREKGRSALCMGNLRQLGLATAMYLSNNNEIIPPDVYTTATNRRASWLELLWSELGGNTAKLDAAKSSYAPGQRLKVAECPSDSHIRTPSECPVVATCYLSYGLNGHIAANRRVTRLKEITHPSDQLLYTEVGFTSHSNGHSQALITVNGWIKPNHQQKYMTVFVGGNVRQLSERTMKAGGTHYTRLPWNINLQKNPLPML